MEHSSSQSRNTAQWYVIVCAVLANAWVWYAIAFSQPVRVPEIYFLDVGQGDAQVAVLPKKEGGSVKVLIDAGKNRKVVEALDDVFGPGHTKYIDVLILSHGDLDHYGGFHEVLRRYDAGVFVYNGVEREGAAFENLMRALKEKNIPILTLLEGSRIVYGAHEFFVISPDRQLLATQNTNEASMVVRYDSGLARALFTGDIGFLAESHILEKGYDLRADILKVSHHGSSKSSSINFVHAVNPRISVIGVGENRYGHPAPRVLDVLRRAGSEAYQTKLHGTVRIVLDGK